MKRVLRTKFHKREAGSKTGLFRLYYKRDWNRKKDPAGAGLPAKIILRTTYRQCSKKLTGLLYSCGALSDRGNRTAAAAAEAPEDILRETNTKQLFLYPKSGRKQEKKPKKP